MPQQRQELIDWAYDPTSAEPVQDWDLLVATMPWDELFLQLAADPNCPKSDFFLSVLYLIVGDAVRTVYATRTRLQVEELLRSSPQHPTLALWVDRSRDLMARPHTFQYEDWCAGGLARQDGPREPHNRAGGDRTTNSRPTTRLPWQCDWMEKPCPRFS